MNAFDYLFSDSKNLDKDFVLGTGQKATFRQIYQDSLKLASYLKIKVGGGQNIILMSHNSVFFITAYLGIIKSGNICVPINPSIEQRNLDYIVESTNCDCVVHSNQLGFELVISASIHINETDLERIVKVQKVQASLFTGYFDKNRIAEILYTSGSTGVPKGVMISHLNITANTDSIVEYLKLSSSDVMGVVLPFFYCYGLSLLHTHLKVGGSLVLINNFIFLGSVISDLGKFKCTGFAGVPSHFQILMKKSQTFLKTEFPHLKYVTQAGGKLHDVFIKEFIKAFPNIPFYVMYGQTEATARLAYLPPNKLREKMGSIGKAIPGVTLQVLDNQGISVKVGELGEITARGDNIMQGYYEDPEGTRAVIRNGCLYTGDLGKVDKDGYIFLVGRKKEIIKVGGKRVSPKEIEEVILSVPEVVDCTVEGVCDELLGEAIKANIVIIKNGCLAQTKAKILETCSDKLVSYKIPQIMFFDKHMNLSLTGKKVKCIPADKAC